MRGLTFPGVLLMVLIIALFCHCGGNGASLGDTENERDTEEFPSLLPPDNDFYQYVNEKWITETDLPAGFTLWTIFDELEADRDEVLLAVLSKSSEKLPYELYSDEWKASEFFSIAMDSLLAENFGMKPIAQFLSRIESISTVNQLANFLIFQERYRIAGFFSFSVDPDPGNGNRMALYLAANELGLGEFSNYLSDDQNSVELRQRYIKHIDRMYTLAGLESDSTVGLGILKIESQLAGRGLKGKPENSEEDDRRYLTTEELGVLSPSINWSAYLSSCGFDRVDSVLVEDVNILRLFESILSGTSMKDIKSYLTWQLIRNSAPYLQHSLVKEQISFRQSPEEKGALAARKNRVLASVNAYMSEAVGRLYVGNSFSPNAKKEAQRLVNTIKISFAHRIKDLNWMSDSTKQIALDRLSSLRLKIGYPDSWKGYSELITDRGPDLGSYWQNVMNGRLFEFEQRAEKLGQVLDSASWSISPQEVAVRYDSLFHELVVTAAALQKPLFEIGGDPAANYGGIGTLIGREISKVLRPLLVSEAPDLIPFEKFGNARQQLADQYSERLVLDSIPLKGEEVIELSIADMAGLVVAFDGLHRSLREEGAKGQYFEKRFFTAWARLWRSKYEKDFLLSKVIGGSFLPERDRVNSSLSNFDEFYANFTILPDSKMYIYDSLRVKIW